MDEASASGRWIDPRYADLVAEYDRVAATADTPVRLFVVDTDE